MANSVINGAFSSVDELEENVKSLLSFAVQTPEQAVTERCLSARLVVRFSTVCDKDNSSLQTSDETIADWFLVLSQTLNAAHPQAAQILRLRLLGFDSHQIAERLQIPPRLVLRVFHTIGTDGVLNRVNTGAAA